MVLKMMKWRPWLSLVSRKYEVRLILRRMEGFDPVRDGVVEHGMLTAEIRWKGQKATLMSSLRRVAVKKNFIKEVELVQNGVVLWDEEFQSVCSLSAYKKIVFLP